MPNHNRRLVVETLESRWLLSGSPLESVTSFHKSISPLGVSPQATSGPTGYTPQQVRHAYGFDQVTFSNGASGDGAGTTIAIVDAYDDPNIVNDLHQFNLQFGLPDTTLTKVNQNGGSTMPTANKGWATEIALDVEWAHAIAPKANILLVEANSSSVSDLMTAVNYARRATGVVAVSMSWGGDEFSSETTYDSYFTTPSGHGGVSFFVSSGDTGAPASFPATSPNVVAVGGTSLYLSQGSYSNESGWNGSGGGISVYEARPSYQNGVVTQTTTRRANPDVAYDSDPNTGFPVYDSYNNGTSTPWGQWGGTSAAAPQWAALTAIADQGRTIAGLGSLDSATQLLPALYQLPITDFHDVTTGVSSGSPNYSASAGYDLVTGRGTPRADLVIRDLGAATTTTATHFNVSTVSSMTAGGTTSMIVTALNSSNQVLGSYRETVQFTSTDTGAGVKLPANYTFTAADNGSHMFSGVTLVTAGSQTITAKDASNSSITGSYTLVVNPGLVTHLAFGQQPTTAGVSAVISPAVTVKLLDAYNNVVTTDSTDSVSLTLNSNSSGGVLSGTTTSTVVAGVATFGNLSINKAGTGYVLTAKSGQLPAVASSAFNVQAAITNLVEGFDASSTYKVVGALSASASASTAAKHDGTRGLADTDGSDWIYRNDSSATVRAGDTVSVWLNFASVASGRAYLGFGSSATGTLALVAAPNSNQLVLQKVGFPTSIFGSVTYTELAAVNQTWQANQWYRLEVNWSTTGQIIGKLFASDGVTLLNSVSGSQSTSGSQISTGGFGFRAIGSGTKYWDTVQVTHGVNSFGTVKNSAKSATDVALSANDLLGAYLSLAQALATQTQAAAALLSRSLSASAFDAIYSR